MEYFKYKRRFAAKKRITLFLLCYVMTFAQGQTVMERDAQWEKDNAEWEAKIKNTYFSASELIDIVDAYSKGEITKIIFNKGGWGSVDLKMYDKSTNRFHRYESLLQVYDENYSFFITNSPAYGNENTPGYNWESTLCTGKDLEVFFHSVGKVALRYSYAYAPEFRDQFVDLGFKSVSKQKSLVDKSDVNGEWTAEIISEVFNKDNYKLVITTEELGEFDDCGMRTEVLLYKDTDMNVSATSASDSQSGSMQQEKDKEHKDKLMGILLIFGIVSLLIFFVMFRISYKKNYKIFIGIWDLVLLIVSAVAFVAAFVIPYYTEDVIWVVLSALLGAFTFGLSVRMSLKHCPTTSVKAISIIAKVAFLSSVLILIIVIEYLRSQRKKELREKGYSNWDKFLDYWDELKDLAYRGDKNVD